MIYKIYRPIKGTEKKVECKECKTIGRFDCETCNTTGQIVCKKCKGAGDYVCSKCCIFRQKFVIVIVVMKKLIFKYNENESHFIKKV